MDPQALKDLADAKFDRSVFLKNLRDSAYSKLGVAYNGGSFTATPELISFVKSWADSTLYVEDNYNNPIMVTRDEFLERLCIAYDQAMSWWYAEFVRGNRIRRAANV